MKSYEVDEIARQQSAGTGITKWYGIDRDINRYDGNQHCFYCNFSLECGEEECIWRYDCL